MKDWNCGMKSYMEYHSAVADLRFPPKLDFGDYSKFPERDRQRVPIFWYKYLKADAEI